MLEINIRLLGLLGLLHGSHGLNCWNDFGVLEYCQEGCFAALNSKQQVKKGCISDIVNENAQVIATSVGDFDNVIMIGAHPICIKICHEDKCNLNRPRGQCNPDQYHNFRSTTSGHKKDENREKNGQKKIKKRTTPVRDRKKRDLFLEYSSHDPITELLGQASELGRTFQYRGRDMNHNSNPKLDEFKFNVRTPLKCGDKFDAETNLDQYKNCVLKNLYNHPSYISYSNFLQPTRRVRMTTQKVIGNILKKRKGAHMDKIIFKKPKNEDGWKNCHDPCSTKCFHWIFDKKTPEEQWQHLITKHPYYFPYAYNPHPDPFEPVDPDTGRPKLVKENERGNFNISTNIPLFDFFENHRKVDELRPIFEKAELMDKKVDLYGRPIFTFGPELLTMYPRMTGDKTPFKVFKNYRFFSKLYDDVETVRRFSPEFWNMFPSAQNFSSNFSELYQNFKDDPSAWPDDILYKPFNPFWARPNDGNRNMVYGANVGPQASRNYAKRIQEVYDGFYSDTNLNDILGCNPLDNKKGCIDISVSYPLSIGFHALGGYRNLNPGGFNAMDFVQGVRDNTRLNRMKYKFNGVKPLNKAQLANNDLVGAGSWIEFAPGLSQAKVWKDAAGENAIETYKQDEMRVLPGFGVSNNPDFSSQGFHHSNFLSMSGSWVGRNHNIPQNKFNLLPDIHDRIGQMKFGQKGAPLQYTSLRSVISGSSASMDRRRDLQWIKDCKAHFNQN